ncbi:tyrosine-type recombinase/integrase [Psychrobacter namhaensis]|uniref:Tyrosine-type recombinase/integrase n=1 Tax=Psychrobacter namhaensis TaxID=292734 RepID=A0ABW8L7Y2_9GAMM
MGTITKRKNKDGTIRYRGVIRIDRDGYPPFNQSKTFSKKALADAWIKKREAEIERNPDILLNREAKSMRLQDVILKYLDEMGDQFGRTHNLSLLLMSRLPLAAKQVASLRREDYTAFADGRLNGKYEGLQPISPATLNGDMITLRAVLRQAKLAWGLNVNLSEFEDAMLGLKHSRKVSSSKQRNRTPTSDELQTLTTYFYAKHQKRRSAYPMHLILWLAIYTARRQDEITRMRLDDRVDDWWLVRDAKNPRGSIGNHINTKVTDAATGVIDALLSEDVRGSMRRNNRHWDDDLLLPLSSKMLSRHFTDACRLLGIEDLHFHDLRHEAATRLSEQGLTVPQMQQVTGHESWSSLQRYVNVSPRKSLLGFDEALSVARLAYSDGLYQHPR